MKIMLTNTLGRKKSIFKPINKGKVGMYVCGPTVYQRASIGNFRAFVFADLLRRMFEFNGLEVNEVMNITDVGHLTDDASEGEDKIEKQAKKENKDAWEISKMHTHQFLDDMKELGIEPPSELPKATDYILEQIALIAALEENGFTYQISDGIYFDTSKLSDYGKLSGQKLDEKEEGTRVEKNKEKKNASDFALWKFSKTEEKRQMEWQSPWGIGFPGWHIECSAMSEKYLGTPFDIHTGGEDHITVHHPNEMAQTQAARGHELANWWLHNAFLMVDGGKMSKSLGNTYSIDDLKEKGFSPLDFRYFLLGAHYRTKQNFTWEALESAHNALNNLKDELWSLGSPAKIDKKILKSFNERINDDLDIAGALAILWETVRNQELDSGIKLATVFEMDKVFGLDLAGTLSIVIPDEVENLLELRRKAREEKDYAGSDALRDQIAELGFVVKDTGDGQKLTPKR